MTVATSSSTSRRIRFPPADVPDAPTVPPGSVGGVAFLPSQETFWPERAPRGTVKDTRLALRALRQAITHLRRATQRRQSPLHLAYGQALVAELKKWERALRLQVDRVRGLR